MDRRGEIGDLNRQIELLMSREKLSEDEVKALCEKVSRQEGRGGLCFVFAPLPRKAVQLGCCARAPGRCRASDRSPRCRWRIDLFRACEGRAAGLALRGPRKRVAG
jgi:hypothetical protein